MKVKLDKNFYFKENIHGGYILYQTKKRKNHRFLKDKERIGKKYDEVVGYYSSIESMLKRFIENKLIDKYEGSEIELKEYIKEFKKLKEEINKLFDLC